MSGRHVVDCGERFERDRAAWLPLPTASYEACEKLAACVSSLALVVCYRGNDYSVPPGMDTRLDGDQGDQATAVCDGRDCPNLIRGRTISR